MAEVQKDSDRITTRWGGRWRTQNCTAWSSESLTANTSVWISLISSKACWLLLYKKKSCKPHRNKKHNVAGNKSPGWWDHGATESLNSSKASCRPWLVLALQVNHGNADFLSAEEQSFSFSPSHSPLCHCTGHHLQTKTATRQAGVQVSFWAHWTLRSPWVWTGSGPSRPHPSSHPTTSLQKD